MGKEAVIDITSCDADKIIRAFEEISNYIGSNIEDVGHQIQQAFISGEHHDWTATRPQDPHKLMVRVKAEDDSDGKMVPIDPKLVNEYDIISYETTAKNHALKKIKYADACVKVYSWIWTLCTLATREKLKTVPDFHDFNANRDFIELAIAIRGITLQFESNKDLSTALTRSLARVIKCKQNADTSLTKHEQRFSALALTFFSYGGSFFFPGVLEIEVRAREKENKSVDLNDAQVKDEIVDKISSEALARIFLDSLDDARYGEFKSRIENSFTEGNNIYPADVAECLTRAQNFSIPRKPFTRTRDGLAFATTAGGTHGGRGGRGRGGRGGDRYGDGAKACYRCGSLEHLARDCKQPYSGTQAGDDASAMTTPSATAATNATVGTGPAPGTIIQAPPRRHGRHPSV